MRTMPTLLALARMTTLASIASATGIPAVGVVEAPGVTCPSTPAVQGALARVRGGPATGEPEFKLFVDRTAEVAHVDLRDGAGESVLARDIPMASGDCEHAAEAIALIVERHFRSLEWSPPAGAARAAASAAQATPPASATVPPPWPAPAVVPPPSLPPPAPAAPSPSFAPAVSPNPIAPPRVPAPPSASTAAPEAPAAPANVAATATAAATPAEQPPLLRFDPAALPRLALGAGPAFWSRGETFAVALDARWRVVADGPVEVGAGVLLPPLHASTAVGSAGSVHVGAVPVTVSVGLTEALGRLAVAMHLGALWTIERGQSDGIPTPATAWRTVLGLGLGASAAWPVTPRLRVTGQIDGYRTVVGRSYSVDGVPGTVLDPSPWQAVIVLGAEWVVLP